MWKEGCGFKMFLGKSKKYTNKQLTISKHSIIRYFERKKGFKKQLAAMKLTDKEKFDYLQANYKNEIQKFKGRVINDCFASVVFFNGTCKIKKEKITYIFQSYVLRTLI